MVVISEETEATSSETNEDAAAEEPKPKPLPDHPLFKSVDDGDMERIQNFLEVEGVGVELQDGTGMTPLMHASWKGHVGVTR